MAEFDKNWIQDGTWKKPMRLRCEVYHAVLILRGIFADGISHTGNWYAVATIDHEELSGDNLEDLRKCKEENAVRTLVSMVREPLENGLFPVARQFAGSWKQKKAIRKLQLNADLEYYYVPFKSIEAWSPSRALKADSG